MTEEINTKEYWHIWQKENIQDYSFNQSIIDAPREGKTVYCRKVGDIHWNSITAATMIYNHIARFICNEWSLTKPKTMVKKQIKHWANIYHDDDYCCFNDEEKAKRDGDSCKKSYKAIAVPFTIEYECEE